MPCLELRLDLPGRHEERHAAVVFDAGVWQPGKSPELLRPAPGFAETRQDIGCGSRAAPPRCSTAIATRLDPPCRPRFVQGECRTTGEGTPRTTRASPGRRSCHQSACRADSRSEDTRSTLPLVQDPLGFEGAIVAGLHCRHWGGRIA